ncbi:gluzincin family metallopeptidase [Kordia aestuariivivens]|uniref:metalloprotease n=1 Tax=Kordia aestuariivivens TaxID=2759037 RepID=UPI001C06F880|nr:metalloprotease [Kordia aestuariivivens]
MNTIRRHFALYLLLLLSISAFGQHKNTLTATVYAEAKRIKVVQKITYQNETGKVLNEIYLNDWNHAFSGKDTPLAKRFAEEYRRNFHLSRKKKKGNTTIEGISTNGTSANWERLEKQIDIIKVTLDKPLQPNESVAFDLIYEVKLPSDEFTRYGYKDDGDFSLRYWYITPAAYNDGWKLYSNKNLDDLYTEQSEHNITLIFPKKFNVISTADTVVNDEEGIVQLTGKNVKDITILLRQNAEFKTYQTDKVNITTNLDAFGLDEKQRAIAIDKVVQFIYEKLGEFPRENMMISKIDNKKNPVYGLGQLPSFIRPFTDDFQYEIKVLKAVLTKNLEESMWMDTRKEKWISDALETYMLMVYAETYYPNMKLTGGLSKVWGVRSYEFAKLEFNDQYPFLYMLMARKNIDQPLSTPKDSLTKFNNNIANKYKAGVGLKYLKSYFDETIIDDFVKEFYTTNRLKKSNRADFENLLKSKAPKDIDWYFDNYVDSRKRIDYKIRTVEKTDDSLQVTIKNKYDGNFPISLFGIKNDSVVSKYWITDVGEKKTVTIPREGIDRLVLNYDKIIPEFNQRDNWKSLNGFFANNKKLKFTFFKDAENPHYNQIFFVPIAQFNLYDGFTPGMRFYNKTFLTKRLLYDFKPSYGLRSKQLVGSGSISYRHDIESKSDLYFARFSMSGNYYNYEEGLTYTRLVPKVTFGFRNPDFRSNQKAFLDFRYIIVQREQSTDIAVENEPNYNVFNARYVYSNPDPIRHFTWFTDFQLAKRFSKISFNLNYRKLFQDNRQLNVRFFFGKFLFNDTNSDFFSFALDRPTDYLFDYNYYGRSEDTGLFSQQLVVAEGGFKSKLENPFSNDWIGTANASYSIWKWIEGYADIGIIKNTDVNARFVYDSGIRLNLVPDYFELYIPVYSNNGWEIAQPGFDQRIRFIVTLSPKTLTKLFTRKWF